MLEIYKIPIDNSLKNLGKNVHMSRPPDIYYLDHQTSGRLPSWTNAEAKNAGLILLKNVLFTVRTLSFSFFFGTLWVWPSCVSDLQTLRPLNKFLPFISSQSLLILLCLADTSFQMLKGHLYVTAGEMSIKSFAYF